MTFKHLIPALLNLFDGEGGAAAPTAAGVQGGTNGAVPGNTRRGKSGEYENVKFGKQPQATAETEPTGTPVAEETRSETITTSNTLEDRRKAYEGFKEQNKDLFAEDVQKILNRRFSETKTLQEQVDGFQPIIDLLSQRFKGEKDPSKLLKALESDTEMWSRIAEESGMDTSTYMQVQKTQRENAQLREMLQRNETQQRANNQVRQWLQEAEALKGKYKAFDFDTEMQNPMFKRQIQAGVPMEHAYKTIHFDEIMGEAVNVTAAQTEKKVVDSVRAKGSRPAENGAASQSAFTVKDDPSKWTKKDRAEVIRRARSGEMIYL
jgi:hypothetical protein